MHPDNFLRTMVRLLHPPGRNARRNVHHETELPRMKKLRLSCEDLRVESFATAPPAEEPGTVHAHAATPDCGATLVGVSCPRATCQTYDDTFCGLTQACE
jgi:hypothetical protein